MVYVEVRQHENLDKALKRFRRQVNRSGVLKELRKRRHYEKPSEARRRKSAAAQRRKARAARRAKRRRNR